MLSKTVKWESNSLRASSKTLDIDYFFWVLYSNYFCVLFCLFFYIFNKKWKLSTYVDLLYFLYSGFYSSSLLSRFISVKLRAENPEGCLRDLYAEYLVVTAAVFFYVEVNWADIELSLFSLYLTDRYLLAWVLLRLSIYDFWNNNFN